MVLQAREKGGKKTVMGSRFESEVTGHLNKRVNWATIVVRGREDGIEQVLTREKKERIIERRGNRFTMLRQTVSGNFWANRHKTVHRLYLRRGTRFWKEKGEVRGNAAKRAQRELVDQSPTFKESPRLMIYKFQRWVGIKEEKMGFRTQQGKTERSHGREKKMQLKR